jgi:plasmid stabilization system protein ParE
MARIELAPEVLEDVDRCFAHMEQSAIEDRAERISEIVQAIEVLTRSPLIGRPVRSGRRELVIGRGSRGYVALYHFVARVDTVFVLAIRSQRERGFPRRR